MMGALPPVSLWGLFLEAGFVVQWVTIGLIVTLAIVAAIHVATRRALRSVRRDAGAFEGRFWSGVSLEDLHAREGEQPSHPMAAVFAAGMDEWNRSVARGLSGFLAVAGVTHRVERAMALATAREMEQLGRGAALLGTIGANAPFVGLSGTLCGVMGGVGAAALFALVVGLIVAIAATVARDGQAAELARFAGRLDAFAAEFSAILSRNSEAAAAPARHAVPVPSA